MTKSLNEKSLADQRKFRKHNGKRRMAKFKQDPNYEYKYVITDTGYQNADDEFERMEKYLDRGWDVVYADDTIVDARASAPDNSEEKKLRTKPVIKRLRGGHTAVLMRIHKDTRQENCLRDKKEREDRIRQSVSAKNITKDSANNIHVTGTDVDLSDLGD